MLFSDIHAKMLEDEKKACPVDGRSFNRRSHVKMNREAQAIKRSIERADRKRSFKRSRRGVFSQEEILQGEEDRRTFREESEKNREASKEPLPLVTEPVADLVADLVAELVSELVSELAADAEILEDPVNTQDP